MACWTLLFAAAVGALLWKHCTVFFYSWTDEQIHLYVAHRMTQGRGAVPGHRQRATAPGALSARLAHEDWLFAVARSPSPGCGDSAGHRGAAALGRLAPGLVAGRGSRGVALPHLPGGLCQSPLHRHSAGGAHRLRLCSVFIEGPAFSRWAVPWTVVGGGPAWPRGGRHRCRADRRPSPARCGSVRSGRLHRLRDRLWRRLGDGGPASVGEPDRDSHLPFSRRTGRQRSVLGELHAVDLRARVPVRGRGTGLGSAGARSQRGYEQRPKTAVVTRRARAPSGGGRAHCRRLGSERGGLPLRRGDRAPAGSAGGNGIRCGGGAVAPGRDPSQPRPNGRPEVLAKDPG